MTNNLIALMCENEKAALLKTEISRIERKMLAVGTDSPIFKYLTEELWYFKQKLERHESYIEYLVNEINKEYGKGE